MIRNPDMVVGTLNSADIKKPNFTKFFLFAGTDSKITQHQCLYEGKAAYQKLEDHVIFGQITIVDGKHKGIENTPRYKEINPLKPKYELLNSDKLWRYISLQKFEDLINSHAIFYARLDRFSDKLEGISPFTCIKAILQDPELTDEQKKETYELYKIRVENNRIVSFASCWHINEKLNFKMWDEYGRNSSESIAIQTNPKKLEAIIQNTGLPVLNEPVRYFDEPYFNQNAYWFPTLFKRSEFEYEKEFRSILFVHGFDQPGLKIKINLNDFLTRIYIHPNAPNEYFKKIRRFVEKSKLKVPVVHVRH